MRPKKHETTGSGDLSRARLDQINNVHQHAIAKAFIGPRDRIGQAPIWSPDISCTRPARILLGDVG